MNRPIVLLQAARVEFDEAANWYDRQRAGLGSRFPAAINDALDRISESPHVHAVVCDDARQAILHKFPYSVIYRVLEDSILVVAVFHSSRDPAVWQRRM